MSVGWGQDCTASDNTSGVELWGVCYSIENTTELILWNSGLTGEIPSEIGNLTNLIVLDLEENQYHIQVTQTGAVMMKVNMEYMTTILQMLIFTEICIIGRS